jgi:hypothetical protein
MSFNLETGQLVNPPEYPHDVSDPNYSAKINAWDDYQEKVLKEAGTAGTNWKGETGFYTGLPKSPDLNAPKAEWDAWDAAFDQGKMQQSAALKALDKYKYGAAKGDPIPKGWGAIEGEPTNIYDQYATIFGKSAPSHWGYTEVEAALKHGTPTPTAAQILGWEPEPATKAPPFTLPPGPIPLPPSTPGAPNCIGY